MAFSKRRRFLRATALLVLGLLVAVAALPVWFPWVLRPVAKHFGATYVHYERRGYQRLRLTGFALTNSSGRLDAQEVQAYLPTVWLWRCLLQAGTAPFLQVDSWNWRGNVIGRRKQVTSTPPPLTSHELQSAGSKIGALEKWLPRAEMTHGLLHLKDETLQISQAAWADGKLSAQLSVPQLKETVHLLGTAESLAPLKLRLALDAPEFQFHSRFTIAGTNNQLHLQGTAFWSSNRIELSARLPENGFVPEAASFRAESFEIPARRLKLEHYRNLTGSLHGNWETNRFELRLTTKMLPQSARWPPIHMSVLASGTAHSVQLDAARFSLGWLDATLSRQTHILLKPPYLAQPTTLDVTADLEKQPWIGARGKLTGEAIVQPRVGLLPQVSFALTGVGLSMANVTAKTLHLKGGLQWPLTNSAMLGIEDLDIPHIRPLRLEASWHGHGMDLPHWQLALRAGASVLQLGGSAALGGEKKKLDVAALELSRSNRTELRLRQPFAVTFQRNARASPNSWMLELQPVIWSGAKGELQLAATATWPHTGTFQIAAHDLHSSLIEDFLQGSTPSADLNYLTSAGGWTNSPVAFHLDSRASWKAEDKLPVTISAKADGGAGGISIRSLSVASATQTVCQAQGSLPIVVGPSGTNGFIQINPDGRLRLQAVTHTNSLLWTEIADATGLTLSEPRLQAEIHGTWAAPQGQITLRAQRIQFPHVKHPWPTLENIDLAAEVNRNEARISRFRFLMDGQPVEFTAQMPFRKHFWSTLPSQRTLPDWLMATAHLKIENARFASLADFTPGMLSPQGTMQGDIVLQPGGLWKGELAITNAATLPLPSLGAIRDIRAAVVFNGQTAELTNGSAAIGGQTVTVDGRMPLNKSIWHLQGLPPFVIHLRGTNVPLVRKPNLLLRADLDLALTNPATGPGTIAGRVRLRDSLFLANLQSLVPENSSTPKEHPPYFSVNTRPWANWHLHLQLNGDRFMQVQTPVFHGKISAAMKLENTLENPLALGEIRISSGAVTFPFGSLNVNQGFVSLTSDNPYHPRLFLTAQVQQYGYNVKLEVTGTADNPIVQFSSTPPLSSQQIVMMLTTGQLPTGVGVTTSTLQRAEGVGVFFGKNLLSEFGLGSGLQNQLTFHTGQQISETGRPTYEANYKLSKRLSIAGEYDQFDQYNLNLKWNIYSK